MTMRTMKLINYKQTRGKKKSKLTKIMHETHTNTTNRKKRRNNPEKYPNKAENS